MSAKRIETSLIKFIVKGRNLRTPPPDEDNLPFGPAIRPPLVDSPAALERPPPAVAFEVRQFEWDSNEADGRRNSLVSFSNSSFHLFRHNRLNHMIFKLCFQFQIFPC
ncbi:hypothetical protein ACQ4LE_003938 [Meloidogyne hapla]